MHELHLIKSLFEDLLKHTKETNVKKVKKVYLRMGEFTEINEDILQYFFKEHSKNTPLENADLEIEPSNKRELQLVSIDVE